MYKIGSLNCDKMKRGRGGAKNKSWEEEERGKKTVRLNWTEYDMIERREENGTKKMQWKE